MNIPSGHAFDGDIETGIKDNIIIYFAGVLRKIGPLDRETNASVELEINATDNGVPSLSTTQKIVIVVTDFNDNFPIFTPHNQTFHVAENKGNGTVIAAINATDADSGNNSVITYSLQDETSKPFTIDDRTVRECQIILK